MVPLVIWDSGGILPCLVSTSPRLRLRRYTVWYCSPQAPLRLGREWEALSLPQLLKAGSTVVPGCCVGQTAVRDRQVHTYVSCGLVGEVVQHTDELGRRWVGPGPIGARAARAQARVLSEHLHAMMKL